MKGLEKIISFVNRSIFISGSKRFEKSKNSIKFVEQTSSCNMMLKKEAIFNY